MALALAQWAERAEIVLDFIEHGRPMQDGFIKRSNGSFRRGALDMHAFRNLTDVQEQPELRLADCNREIPNDNLAGLTPPNSGNETFRLPQAMAGTNQCKVDSGHIDA